MRPQPALTLNYRAGAASDMHSFGLGRKKDFFA